MRSFQWDIFCSVIDNFGDIGICWRLAADLATRGQRVRLWVDDGAALAWLAPEGLSGVQVLSWTKSLNVQCLHTTPCDVLIEAFGCDVAPEFIAASAYIICATGQNDVEKPLWINLEYLSAEPYVEKSHGLKHLVSSGPGAGWQKVFYYPGFTPATAGLLHEPDVPARQAAFDRAAWLKNLGVECTGNTVISLFCYEPPLLSELLEDLARHGMDNQPVHLLVTAGRATEAVKGICQHTNVHKFGLEPAQIARSQLSISYLPLLCQTDFDHLLWASDINFVRGEDSVVRALWAGKPFVWQIYPQDDGAHEKKLEAFMDMLDAPISWRAFHRSWNGLAAGAWPRWADLRLADIQDWAKTAADNCSRLARLPDLTTGLLEFAAKNR